MNRNAFKIRQKIRISIGLVSLIFALGISNSANASTVLIDAFREHVTFSLEANYGSCRQELFPPFNSSWVAFQNRPYEETLFWRPSSINCYNANAKENLVNYTFATRFSPIAYFKGDDLYALLTDFDPEKVFMQVSWNLVEINSIDKTHSIAKTGTKAIYFTKQDQKDGGSILVPKDKDIRFNHFELAPKGTYVAIISIALRTDIKSGKRESKKLTLATMQFSHKLTLPDEDGTLDKASGFSIRIPFMDVGPADGATINPEKKNFAAFETLLPKTKNEKCSASLNLWAGELSDEALKKFKLYVYTDADGIVDSRKPKDELLTEATGAFDNAQYVQNYIQIDVTPTFMQKNKPTAIGFLIQGLKDDAPRTDFGSVDPMQPSSIFLELSCN